jgi:hypothetical protein
MCHPVFACEHLHSIRQHPQASANGYVQMCGADLVAATGARGAPPICRARGGTTLRMRGPRPSEAPTAARARRPSADDSSHNPQFPPDLVVKFQAIDIAEVILWLGLRLRVVYQQEIKG